MLQRMPFLPFYVNLTNKYNHVNDRYFLALAEIAKKGYMVSSRKDVLSLSS